MTDSSTSSSNESMRELDDFSVQIEAARRSLGEKLLILAHHYTSDDVYLHADLRGDSFQLSAAAARNEHCDTIVFCGVHFMAETADILANSPEKLKKRRGNRVDVVLPDPQAGCSMADMASIEEIEAAWKELSDILDPTEIVPITYVNSSADLKAFCGRNGGIACTSTNAAAVLEWAFARHRDAKVLFFPDQHLGRNTALKLGIPEEKIRLWNRNLLRPFGGNSVDEIQNGKIILWDGCCNIHQKFTPEQVKTIRAENPGIRVIVHPECDRKVVDLADLSGSTNLILQEISESPAGSQWAVGTEWHMVHRLTGMFPDKKILNLSPEPSVCETMALNTGEKLARTLEGIIRGTPENLVRVPDSTAADARIALKRMLQVK